VTSNFDDPNRYGIPGVDDQVSGSAAQQAGITSNRGGGSSQDSAAAAKAAGGTSIDWSNPNSIRDAWMRAGAPDYNAMVRAGIGGYQGSNGETSAADIPYSPFSGSYSPEVDAARKKAASPVSGYNNYYDWYAAQSKGSNGGTGTVGSTYNGMGDVQKNDQVVNQNVNPTVAGGGQADTSGASNMSRLMELWANPQATANEVLKSLGMGDYNTGPLANFMRSKSSMIKPAYYLDKGSDATTMNNPQDYLDFAKNFLSSAGSSLGDVKSKIQNALGMNPGGQSQGWKEMLSGTNPSTGQPWLTDAERQNWIGSLVDLMSMNNFNPMQGYKSGALDRQLNQFAQDYGTGRVAPNTDYMEYIRQKLPEFLGQ
jgi:hypothetical protein